MKAIKQLYIIILAVIMVSSQVSAIMHTHDFVLYDTQLQKIHIQGNEYTQESTNLSNHVHCALCDISYTPGYLTIHKYQTIVECSNVQYLDISPSQFYSFCTLQKQTRAPPYTT